MSKFKEMSFSPSIGYAQETVKSTLVSIVPFPIREFKPGLCPSQFDLPACTGEEPVFLVIDQAHHFVYIDSERGSLRVLDPSYEVATAIVADYNSAQIQAEPGAHPGFFWLLGEWNWSKMQGDARVLAQLEEIRAIQARWFINLVQLGDDDWERTRQHSSISDQQRFAVKAIDPSNTRGRQWVSVAPTEMPREVGTDSQICPACGSDVPKSVALCRFCTFVLDEAKFAQMQFANRGGTESIASRVLNAQRPQ